MSILAVSPPVPRPVRAAVVVWLVAVGAGVAETLVHLALPDPPGPAALAKRAVIYAGVVVLVLALPKGRNVVRWTLAVLLGVVGTASLVVEPLTWLATGASPVEYLAERGRRGPRGRRAARRAPGGGRRGAGAHVPARGERVLQFAPASSASVRSWRRIMTRSPQASGVPQEPAATRRRPTVTVATSREPRGSGATA